MKKKFNQKKTSKMALKVNRQKLCLLQIYQFSFKLYFVYIKYFKFILFNIDFLC